MYYTIIKRYAKKTAENKIIGNPRKAQNNNIFTHICRQQLNREIAQNVYNRGADSGGGADVDSLHPMGIDTKKDLLSRIHMKNKYIKRLLCENESLRHDIDMQNEQNIQLDICLRQTTDRLTKAHSDLLELNRQNTISAEEIVILNNKIKDISRQMTIMEKDKLKYRNDILFLGQEIHKRVDKWNDTLRTKRGNLAGTRQDVDGAMDTSKGRVSSHANEFYDANVGDGEHSEISVLSQVMGYKLPYVEAHLNIKLTIKKQQ